MKFNNYIYVVILIVISTFSNGQSPNVGTVCAESQEYYGVTGYEGSTFTWAVENGGVIVEGDGEDTIQVLWGYNVGTYMMEVLEVTSSGCVGAPVTAYVTVQAPEVDLGFDNYEICDGDSLILDATGDYDEPATYLWQDGSTGKYFTADQTEDIWVKVTDQLGCVRYDYLDFVAHSLPVVDLGNDTVLCDVVNPLELDAGDFVSYEWISNNEEYFGNPIYIAPVYSATDTVRVIVTDINGCQNSDTMLVFPCDASIMFADMYNTFTPNGDGDNDVWIVIEEMDQFPDAVLEIFDRWGRLVYRTTSVADEPWDGTSKGRDMPMDAYFFVLELNYMGMDPITGTVNLIR